LYILGSLTDIALDSTFEDVSLESSDDDQDFKDRVRNFDKSKVKTTKKKPKISRKVQRLLDSISERVTYDL
jgi:hypothetical protein